MIACLNEVVRGINSGEENVTPAREGKVKFDCGISIPLDATFPCLSRCSRGRSRIFERVGGGGAVGKIEGQSCKFRSETATNARI